YKNNNKLSRASPRDCAFTLVAEANSPGSPAVFLAATTTRTGTATCASTRAVAEEHLPGRVSGCFSTFQPTTGHRAAACISLVVGNLQRPSTVPLPFAGGQRAQESEGQRQKGVSGGSCTRRRSDLRDCPHRVLGSTAEGAEAMPEARRATIASPWFR
ncbi:hypothetical protein INR49_016362, partial [Caranx melampygus]